MRTTITLDDDNARMLEELRRRAPRSFKDAVNDAIRAGLAVLLARPKARGGRYVIEPIAAEPRVTNVDNIAEILSVSEGERRS